MNLDRFTQKAQEAGDEAQADLEAARESAGEKAEEKKLREESARVDTRAPTVGWDAGRVGRGMPEVWPR